MLIIAKNVLYKVKAEIEYTCTVCISNVYYLFILKAEDYNAMKGFLCQYLVILYVMDNCTGRKNTLEKVKVCSHIFQD